MNDADVLIFIVVAIVVAVIWYVLGENAAKGAEQQNFVVQPPINYVTGKANSPYYGESNPINAYNELLQKTGVYNTYQSGLVTTDDERNHLLALQGVINPTDQEQHRIYYQSNVGKYPLQIAGDTHEMRDTRSPYVAGTRSLRAVPIGPYESQVPDKLERTVKPSQ